MRLALLVMVILPFVQSSATAADNAKFARYEKILKDGGVKPTPEGILEYLSPLSAKRLGALIAQLGDSNYEKRQQATKLLSSLPAVPSASLQTAAESDDPEVRYRAKLIIERNRAGRNSSVMHAALQRIRGEEFAKAAPILVELIPQFQRTDLVMAAATALKSVAQKSHSDLLRKTLYASSHTPLRIAVLQALASIGDKAIIPDLRRLQTDKDEKLRFAAGAGLLGFKERTGLKTLAGLLKSDNVQIRADSVAYLQAATHQKFGYLAVDRSPARQRAAEAWSVWVDKNGATCKLYDATAKTVLASHALVNGGDMIHKLTSHGSTAYCVAFSPDGKQLVSCGGDRMLKLWNVATGKLLWSKSVHTSTIRGVDFSPDGTMIATGSYDRTIKLWDAKTQKLIRTFTGHKSSVRIIDFSPDGKLLASAGSDNQIRIWDVATGKSLKTLIGHTQTVRSVAFRSDGQLLASSSSDKSVRLWNVKTGALVTVLAGHTSSARSVAFSPDNRTLVSCSLDNTVRLWDVNSGKERVTLRGHSLSVKCVDFDRKGRFIISAGNDRTVRVWDPATGKSIATLTGPTSSIWHCAISPDGNLVAACGSDRSVYIWRLTRKGD